MAGEGRQLHIFMFPFTALGHTIPMVGMAKLFASRGVKITIVTTPLNSVFISKSIHQTAGPGEIQLLILNFPYAEVGLPENSELVSSIRSPELVPKYFKALKMLEGPLEKALLEKRAHCLVADMLLPWTIELAARVGIPRLIAAQSSAMCLCASDLLLLHRPDKHVSSDSEPFTVPDLPGEITYTKLQIPEIIQTDDPTGMASVFDEVRKTRSKCLGMVLDGSYEMEQDYANCYRNTFGVKLWHLGPFCLTNKETEKKVESSMDNHECFQWLNSKKPKSVVYACFGSMNVLSGAQLKEVANALEASGQHFILAVGNKGHECLPEGFEERMEGRGLIIKGWAQQALILEHPAVGGFVTHSGWNSVLEAAAAGVPMATWPIGADQMHNQKLVTQVLKIGVPVGVQKFVGFEGEFIGSEVIQKAISRIMEGEEAEEMRSTAAQMADKARKAVAEGGSSFSNLSALIEELKSLAF